MPKFLVTYEYPVIGSFEIEARDFDEINEFFDEQDGNFLIQNSEEHWTDAAKIARVYPVDLEN